MAHTNHNPELEGCTPRRNRGIRLNRKQSEFLRSLDLDPEREATHLTLDAGNPDFSRERRNLVDLEDILNWRPTERQFRPDPEAGDLFTELTQRAVHA